MAERLSDEPGETFQEVQQNLYMALGDRDWNCYRLVEDKESIRSIIEFGLFKGDTFCDLDKKEKMKRDKKIDELVNTIIENGVYCEGRLALFMNILYNVCENLEKPDEITIHTVFCLRKCAGIDENSMSFVNENVVYAESTTIYELMEMKRRLMMDIADLEESMDFRPSIEEKTPCSEYCRIFIDENLRVYGSWNEYLNNNRLHKCKMVVPRNGKYQGQIVNETEETSVILEVYKSPACAILEKGLSVVDISATVVGIGSAATTGVCMIPAVAAAVTFTPVIIGGSLIVGGIVGTWSLGRSIARIYDRRMHKQTIGISDSEARNCWLTVAGSVTGIVTGASMQIFSRVVRNGAVVGMAGRAAINGLTATNIAVNACGVVNSGYTIIDKKINGEPVTTLDVLQFTTTLLFFGNAVVSAKTANTIIQEAQNNALADYELALSSNRKRRMYQKALKESQRVKGEHVGKADFIKGLRKVNNIDELFGNLGRTNKIFNDSTARFTVDPDGNILVNNKITLDLADFSTMTSAKLKDILTNAPPKPATFVSSTTPKFTFDNVLAKLQNIRGNDVIVRLVMDVVSNPNVLVLLEKMFTEFTDYVKQLLADILGAFISRLSDEIKIIKQRYPFVNPIIVCLQFIIKALQMNAEELSYQLSANGLQDYKDFLKYFEMAAEMIVPCRNGAVSVILIGNLFKRFKKWLIEGIDKQLNMMCQEREHTPYENTKQLKCNACNGYYFTKV